MLRIQRAAAPKTFVKRRRLQYLQVSVDSTGRVHYLHCSPPGPRRKSYNTVSPLVHVSPHRLGTAIDLHFRFPAKNYVSVARSMTQREHALTHSRSRDSQEKILPRIDYSHATTDV